MRDEEIDTVCAVDDVTLQAYFDDRSLVTNDVLETAPNAELIAQIERLGGRDERDTIASALRVRILRKRVEAGMMGPGVKWYSWALKNIDMRKTRLWELQTVAEADDMAARLKEIRDRGAERQKTYQNELRGMAGKTKKKELEPERLELISFASKKPIVEVRRALKFAREGSLAG